jgi:acetate kinase
MREPLRRQLSQFVVNQGEELVGGLRVAFLDGQRNLDDPVKDDTGQHVSSSRERSAYSQVSGVNGAMNALICNAGSSTLKFSLFETRDEQLLADGLIDWTTSPARLRLRRPGQSDLHRDLAVAHHADALVPVLDTVRGLSDIQAVGHRIVHGGDRYTAAAPITPDVKRAIGELAELAPLHNPPSLECIVAVENALPGVPQVAAFDTAFHATLPAAARIYPVPRQWAREWGIRRYGFHGLSHSYCAGRAAEMVGRRDMRLIIAHLGNGASVSAVRAGTCIDTSMGFTPLEGLMMGTRSGSVDPGVLIYLLRQKGLDAAGLDRALNHESGLLGVSGVSSDMRQVLAALPQEPDARLAIDIYVHRLRQTIGAMAATLGGVDGLVFTAGVGENSPEIRERVCENLSYLGLVLDPNANRGKRPDADIAAPDSPARILIIATREDVTIIRAIRQLIGS